MEEKEISCGFLLRDKSTKKYLVCHSTGKSWKGTTWDLPKGHLEDNEEPLATAIRELYEETSIKLDDNIECLDFELQPYVSYKDLHLFLYEDDFLPKYEKNIKCTSFFINQDGDEIPEVNAFAWIEFEKLEYYLFPSLWKLIKKLNEEHSFS